jgi:membrane protease YdiL (CAAX protease family)
VAKSNKGFVLFKWAPNNDLPAVLVSWILVVLSLSYSTFVITGERGGVYFIFYAILTALVFGVFTPVFWTVFISKRQIKSLGITFKGLIKSLTVQLVLSLVLWLAAYRSITLPPQESLIPLIALALCIGFFEAVFWRGWVVNRLEESFGIIPAIIIGSALYSLYHVGYGMPASELLFLFFIGVMFSVVFKFTGSIFILWPLFQPMGQVLSLVNENLPLPQIAILGFGEILLLMVLLCVFIEKVAAKKGIKLAKN